MREKILFDSDWRFHEGDIEVERPTCKTPVYAQAKTVRKGLGPASIGFLDDENAWLSQPGWRNISLPHDYIVKQTPNQKENETNGFFHYTNAWYRKHFRLSTADKDKRITLIFDGVATHATVYVNGCLMKHNFCGYTSFEVDITDVVWFDEKRDNVIAVYVDTTEFEGWWYQGGGIYRHVWLQKTDRVCIDLYGVYAKPIRMDDTTWKVHFETTVRNENYSGRGKRITAESTIADETGKTVARACGNKVVEAKGVATITYEALVKDPLLWDVDAPHLYTVTTELKKNGVICDTQTDRIGFRTAVCDPEKGFFLNGKPIKINGVCNHQDFGLAGLAIPDNICRYKVEQLKEMGANGYRCSHYPQTAATMDALDELGFIVMNECRWFESTDEGLAQMTMVMKRDRNRPSVFFWSLGNEEPHAASDVGRRIAKSMYAAAKKLDDQRFIMTAVDRPADATVYDCLDVVGVNYHLDTYEKLHETYPDRAIFASECCAHSTTRNHYYDTDKKHGYIDAYDDTTTPYTGFCARQVTWKFLYDHDWIMGGYQWTGHEYRGEAFWPRLCSQSGSIDLYFQKKDAFYLNQSLWTKTPMIHLLPHWNWQGCEGRAMTVQAYTNCSEAELFLNGTSLGRQTVERFGHGEWTVSYAPGELKVVGYEKGKAVVEDVQRTSGQPAVLRLKLDNHNAHKKGDVAIYTCYVVDEQDVVVPDATDFVRFYTCGPGKVIGTGSDVCDHVPPHIPDRKMREGRITVAVELTADNATVELFATGDRLGKAYIKETF